MLAVQDLRRGRSGSSSNTSSSRWRSEQEIIESMIISILREEEELEALRYYASSFESRYFLSILWAAPLRWSVLDRKISSLRDQRGKVKELPHFHSTCRVADLRTKTVSLRHPMGPLAGIYQILGGKEKVKTTIVGEEEKKKDK